MDKKLLSIKTIIRRQRYYAQLFAFSIFFLAGCSFGIGDLIVFTKKFNIASLIIMCMNFIFCFLIFGYYLGLRNIIKTLKCIRKIKNYEFTISRGILKNKTRLPYDDSNRHCTFHFDTEDINVPQHEFDKANIGDQFYFLILDGDQFASGIFRTKEYKLDEELMQKLR